MASTLLLDTFRFQRGYLTLLVDDIPDGRMAEQFGPIVNHPAWQLGHMAWALDGIGSMLGGPKRFDDAWTARFGMHSSPTADRGAYPSKSELIAILDERRETFTKAYAAAPAELLKRTNPIERLAPLLPTIEHAVSFGMSTHEATHLGQLSIWRRAAGMPQALSRLA